MTRVLTLFIFAAVAIVAGDANAQCLKCEPNPVMLDGFDTKLNEHYGIYVIDVDGSHYASLTKGTVDDFFPSWTRDGSKIAFNSRRDGNWEIYFMNADGSNQIRLTNNPARDIWPSWSPDKAKIASLPIEMVTGRYMS